MKRKFRNRILASLMSMVMVVELVAMGSQSTVFAETLEEPELGVTVVQTLAEDQTSMQVEVQTTLPEGFAVYDLHLGDYSQEGSIFTVTENGTYTLTINYGPVEEGVPTEEPTLVPSVEPEALVEETSVPEAVEEVPAEPTEEALPELEETTSPEQEAVPTEESEETGVVFFYDTQAEEETPAETNASYTYTEEIVVAGIVAGATIEESPALSPVVLSTPARAPRISSPVTIVVQDEATGELIEGANFNFYKEDLSTHALTSIGTDATDASGEASIDNQPAGKYVAVYANDGSIDASKYDVSGLIGHKFEITVTADDTPGVQLTEDWAWDLGSNNFKWRDMIIDGDAVLACGQVSSVMTIPGAYTLDGNPITIDPADGTGILVKIDQATGKMIYYTQYPSGAASYSMVKSGNLYAVTTYKNNVVLINSNDGTIVNTIDASTYFGGSSTQALFDITATSDGGYALVGWDYKLCKIDATGNLVYTTTNVMPDAIKSVMEVAPDTYVISGGGNGPYAYLTKIQVAADGTPTTIFTSRVGDGTGNSRFNDVLAVEEDGHQYYLASGNYGCTTAGCTIPGSETADGNSITLMPSTMGALRTACLFKYDENGKIVFAIALGGNDMTNLGAEQEFNNVKLAYDSLGGYIVSGQLVGTATVAASDTMIGQTTTINSGSTGNSGSIIVRYTTDGKYVDSYTEANNPGDDDQFYGGVVTENNYFTSGEDSSKSIVKLSSALTSSPRVVKVPKILKYKLTTAVVSSDGTISGLGWSYYEEVQNGGTNTKVVTATANSGYLVTKVEIINVDTNTVEQTLTPSAASYTVAAGSITMDSNKLVKAYFGLAPVTTPVPTPDPTSTPGTRTCQDDGYPAGYYWNGTTCVIDATPTPTTTPTAKPTVTPTATPTATPSAKPSATPKPSASASPKTTPVVEAFGSGTNETASIDTTPQLFEVMATDVSHPRFGGSLGHWALVNLLAALASLLLAILHIFSKSTKETDQGEYLERNGWLRIGTIACAVASVFIFIFTEDLTKPMVAIDPYTILTLALLLVSVIFFIVGKKWKEATDQE